MYIILVIFLVIILSFIGFSFTKTGKTVLDFFSFFTKGKDKGFSTANLFLLWRTANFVGLEDKPKLFWSIPALDDCIAFIARQVENPISEDIRVKMQAILNKLYDYRTKVELKKSEKKRAIETTREIFQNQICIVLVPNETTIYAKIISNTKTAINLALYEASFNRAKTVNWANKFVRVYFWRKNDAGYIFPSTVIGHKIYNDHLELSLKHSTKLTRTQKRKSIRAACNFEALMFPLKASISYNSEYEKAGGVKCIINDISENGAMIFVKGKAAKNLRMKLQFKIRNIPVVMCGRIVRYIYEHPLNKSRVHFQCQLLDQKSRNTILSYVYDISSEDNSEFISTLFEDNDEKEFNYEADLFEDLDTIQNEPFENTTDQNYSFEQQDSLDQNYTTTQNNKSNEYNTVNQTENIVQEFNNEEIEEL